MDRGWLTANCPRIAALGDAVKARPKIAPVHAANFS
jgi:hypothetical protein